MIVNFGLEAGISLTPEASNMSGQGNALVNLSPTKSKLIHRLWR